MIHVSKFRDEIFKILKEKGFSLPHLDKKSLHIQTPDKEFLAI
jgi:hypothetical protein